MGRQIIVVAIGSAGDVHPLAIVARALQEKGHRVSLLANGHFAPLAAHLGLPFTALGSEDDYQRAMLDAQAWDPRQGFPTVWRYMQPSIEATFDWIKAHADTETVLLGSSLAFGARIARDALRIPLITAHLAPILMLSAIDPPQVGPRLFPQWLPRALTRGLLSLADRFVLDPLTAPEINRVRAKAGLDPVRHLMRDYIHSPDRVLLMFPEWFAADPGDWPRQCVHAGFPLFDEAGLHKLPPALQRFLDTGDKPLLFTPGSAMQHAHRFFDNAVTACRTLGKRGLVVTRYTDQLPPLPPEVLQIDYVPFSQLLPHVELAAYHGGIGTCAQTLAAAVPHLIVANAHDQFDNGRRVERLGVGTSVSRTAGARVFTRAIERLLLSSDTRQRCRQRQSAVETPQAVIDKACRVVQETCFVG